MKLEKYIRDIPDFPRKGIIFKDITTLLKNGGALRKTVKRMAAQFHDEDIDAVVAVEARGFILGGAVALELGAGFIPVRKPGKLPAESHQETYELEYGTDSVEIHKDAIEKGQKVLIVDDLLATGGTVAAVEKLLKKFGCKVIGIAFLIELDFLKGREKLSCENVVSLIHCE